MSPSESINESKSSFQDPTTVVNPTSHSFGSAKGMWKSEYPAFMSFAVWTVM